MGSILNLNFPSNVHTMDVNGKEVTYGYSSGTYARLNPMFDRVSLLPRQEEIDALGAELRRQDWKKRFELVYQRLKQRCNSHDGCDSCNSGFRPDTSSESMEKSQLTYGNLKLSSAQAYAKYTISGVQY